MDEPRRFMLHFPEHHRGAIANLFYHAVRNGLHYPKAICSAVFQGAVERYARGSKYHSGSVEWRDVLHWLKEDQEGALDFALDVYMREARTPEERRTDKEEEERRGKLAYMSRFPATEKQEAVLRRLGYSGEIRDRGHASELIEELKTW